MTVSRSQSRARAGWLAMRRPPARVTRAVVIPPGTGRAINAGGIPAAVLISPDTCPALLVHEQGFAPLQRVRAHWHAGVTQWSMVTAGVLTFMVGDEEYTVAEGGVIIRPPGVVHAVWNPSSSTSARQVEGATPGEPMLEFFEKFGQRAVSGALSSEEVASLAAQYGTFYDDELTQRIDAEHGVSAEGELP